MEHSSHAPKAGGFRTSSHVAQATGGSSPRSGSYSRSGAGRSSGGFSRGSSSYGGGSGSRFSSSHSGRGGHRGTRSGGGFSHRGGGRSQHIDISRFINKAVVTEEKAVFVPEHQFTDFAVDARLKANIVSKGYKLPTPIQDRVIPYILKGSDVVGIANTGTGKTAAFLVPLINKALLAGEPKSKAHPKTLIMVPTRELAQQIEGEIHGFLKGLKLYSVCCVGGSPMGRQISSLRYHNDFIIGTPGRLKDLIEQKYINLAEFHTVVLDEADRMLDMGFIADMRWMMARMPKPRHTLFFSATLSKEIEGLIKEFLHEPVMVSVKTQETAKNIDQDIIRIQQGMTKIDVLHDLLNKAEFKKVLIFGKTKHGTEKLSHVLNERGFKSDSIHGNKSQSQRQRALAAFKAGAIQVLTATDVAARGLDIVGVTHVINFDIPATYDDYVHRIGRTGRGGNTGKALTFVE